MLKPRVGQLVRHGSFEGNMIVKSVQGHSVVVELIPISDEEGDYPDRPVVQLLPADELYEV